MDWQQLVALLIVGLTACAFIVTRVRSRRFSFKRDTHCGCSSADAVNGLGAKQTIRFHARKGERPEILIKNA